MNIYVSNLSFDMRDEDLKKFFIPYGEVSSARIIMDKMTDRSRGFGFVEMGDDTAAQKAITELNGAMVDGRPLRVNEAKPKSDNKSFGGSGGGGSRGDGRFNNSKSYNQNRY
jgi:RNA recognition motif-containing protein